MNNTNNNSNRITTHHSTDRSWAIHYGDVNKVLPTLPPVTFDGVFCDPPYGLNFMGHNWDESVPPATVFQGLLRLCKPGGYLLAFGGPKTFHRLACNIEDAGWEIRDTLCWLYGDGFPKSHNISKAIDKKLDAKRRSVGKTKAIYRYGYNKSDKNIEITTPGSSDEAKRWDGYGTALKPAWEPIILAMKPVDGTFAENALTRSNGGLNIDECRIGTSGGSTRSHQPEYPRLEDGSKDHSHFARRSHNVDQIDKGRWPANLLLDEEAAAVLDEQSGKSKSRRSRRRKAGSNVGNGKTLNAFRSRMDVVEGYDDEGGASRFFYCAKARGKKRKGNDHPTVKPLALCEYLARLILQPKRETPRRLLVPFSGSGSEMIGALSAGWDHVTGIEKDDQYVATARRRLSEHKEEYSRPA